MDGIVKELVDVGGPRLLIPAALFILVLYAIRGLAALHGRRNQNRREFLDLWNETAAESDLWLEVAVRHLFGRYLPTRIIRFALTQQDKARSLIDLAELWPLFKFDPQSQTISWRHRRHSTAKRRTAIRALMLAGYAALALLALFFAQAAFQIGPTHFFGWLYGVCAATFGASALFCLTRESAIKDASETGESWIRRINDFANPSVVMSADS